MDKSDEMLHRSTKLLGKAIFWLLVAVATIFLDGAVFMKIWDLFFVSTPLGYWSSFGIILISRLVIPNFWIKSNIDKLKEELEELKKETKQ